MRYRSICVELTCFVFDICEHCDGLVPEFVPDFASALSWSVMCVPLSLSLSFSLSHRACFLLRLTQALIWVAVREF